VIGRSVWIKTGVFVVIAVLGIGYILEHYVGVGRSVFGTSYTAYVDLADSGGIFPTASVTYRGVEVGRVGPIELRDDGIRVALKITSGTPIPEDARAIVANGSPIGEQYVDLRPNTGRPPYLHQGSVIPQSRTVLPTSTQDLLVNLDQLVRSVPRDDLHTVVTELGTAFEETGPALRRLLDSSHDLLRTATATLPESVRLIDDSGRVLDTQNDLSGSIISFSKGLDRFSEALRSSDADLRKVLEQGVPASSQIVELDHALDATLPVLLGNLTSLGKITAVRIPAIRQVLIIYPYVVSTSYGLFPHNGTTRFGVPIPPANDHQPCKQGYWPAEKRRLPEELRYPPMRWNAFCKVSTKADINVRGSRMAPQPGGGRLGDRPGYMNNSGLPGGGGGGRATYELGSTGGAQQLFGDESWLSLVFGPLL
jgi:phospholipid/cholesterol/gamma-HCH transport system substrate-binding protein